MTCGDCDRERCFRSVTVTHPQTPMMIDTDTRGVDQLELISKAGFYSGERDRVDQQETLVLSVKDRA